MSKNLKALSLLLALLLSLSAALSGCDLLKKGGDAAPEGVQLPSMLPDGEGAQLQRDDKGFSEADRQYLAYAKEKWQALIAAADRFGNEKTTYLDRIHNQTVRILEDKDYLATRDELLKAAKAIEYADPSRVTEPFKNLFGNMLLGANRSRRLICQILAVNGTEIENDFSAYRAVLDDLNGKIQNFFSKADNESLDAAAAAMPPLDYAALAQDRPEDRIRSFNIGDYGLNWGVSRWAVMGVEGMQENAFATDTLSYPCYVYNYNCTRVYHFNEQGQLDSYHYDIDGTSFDRGTNPDPVQNDMYELGSIVMYFFILDDAAVPQQVLTDEQGNYMISFDPPAESVILKAVPNDPSQKVTLDVIAKRAEAQP